MLVDLIKLVQDDVTVYTLLITKSATIMSDSNLPSRIIADVALCPFEAVKVPIQTLPGFARGFSDGLPKFFRAEEAAGLYKGFVPLCGRQIPYAMMKFASFETIVEQLYKNVIPTPKDQSSKSTQLGVSFAGGYLAGILCAIVSHPADNLVSFLNNAKGATVGDAVNKLGVMGLCTRGLPIRIVMKYYTNLAVPENAAKYKTLIFLAGSASAEVIADVALCPFEAVKVRIQTLPGFARGLSDGLPKFVRAEGATGLYKGLVPLCGRQIPYTMMKFASFETIVEQLYKNVIPTPKDQCSKSTQLGVSFGGGYLAGCEQARRDGSLYSRSSYSYSDDWYTHRSTMGHL
ncbi:Mitochondrial phosphate carrier protein 3, mitochondrial [Capsicum chinense]|nr:Mitochondrial phosphate carrier protein 3, mitochondrial [Capsicum chinense]